MKASASPTGKNTSAAAATGPEDENKNAAFLGEADSDDGFEADVEANPEAHRHRLEDVTASGLHGQSGRSPLSILLLPWPVLLLQGAHQKK